jgi:type II secretory ATPase GspE/PulE/Tfp pilus assembly ATPase PilB-like protein
MTFAAGLRSLLRQDPDIIMVGEIRDSETLEIALNAAMTGHLVLSTLHTNSAAAALPRMLDMGAEPFLIASTANVIVAQRLGPEALHVDCRKPYQLDEKQLASLGEEL